MSNFRVHKGGRIRLGSGPGDLTDVSNDFRSFEIEETRTTVVKPATPISPMREQKASAGEATVSFELAVNPGDTSGAWSILNAAISTRTAEVYFDVVQGRGAVSETNPKSTGYLVVTSLRSGNPAMGALRSQTSTVPARAVAGPITSE